jgi:hypothetical protein
MVISHSSSEERSLCDSPSSKRSTSRSRTRKARRCFEDYLCDTNNTSADVTDDDDEDWSSPKTNSGRKRSATSSKRNATRNTTVTTTSAPRKAQNNGVVNPFPVKLHQMLEGNAANGMDHIASWQPHGRCFVVHKQREFVDLIMPEYFQQSKYPSFQRQLNLYGFKRITKGPDRNGYHHPNFLRGRPELTHTMVRIKVKGTGVRKPTRPEEEPNFYEYPDLHATGNIKASPEAEISKKAANLRRSGPGLYLIKAIGTSRGKVLSRNPPDDNASGRTGNKTDHRACHQSPNRIVTPPISPEDAYDRTHMDIADVLEHALLIESPRPGAASVQLQNEQNLDITDHSMREFEAWPTPVMTHPPTSTAPEADSDICFFFGRPFHYLEAIDA